MNFGNSSFLKFELVTLSLYPLLPKADISAPMLDADIFVPVEFTNTYGVQHLAYCACSYNLQATQLLPSQQQCSPCLELCQFYDLQF